MFDNIKNSNIHSRTIDALVDYLRDCKMKASDLVPMNLALALEYIYQPRLTFWREFDISLVIHALDKYIANWRETVNQPESNEAEGLLKEVEEILRLHAFDESNAERLLALHGGDRPSGRAQASEWIHAELTQLGLHDDAAYAARDGYRCGEGALEIVYCVEQAAKGLRGERLGMGVARFYRNAAMSVANPTTNVSVAQLTVSGD